MTTLQDLPVITPHLLALADCVCNELDQRGAGPLCRCGFHPGAIPAFDGCGDCGNDVCGMGWLRVVTAYPYETFPVPSLDPHCRHDIAWQIEVGSVRCMPITQDGSALESEQLMEVWVSQMLDAEALHRAVLCCEAPIVTLGTYTPVGPSGGCVGGYWTAFVGL